MSINITAGSELLQVSGLRVRYEGNPHWILDNIHFSQLVGKITAVIGPSGCGKTTLIQTACGLIPHCIPAVYTGSIRLLGVEIAHASENHIGVSTAYVGQNPDISVVTNRVGDEVCFALQNLNLPVEDIYLRAKNALAKVGLANFWEESPWHLSGGQRQRLALAAALAMKPKLLVLDEPTSTIDTGGRSDFYQLLPSLIKDGLAVLVVDHDLDPFLSVVDNILALDDNGSMFAFGSAREVFTKNLGRLQELGVWLPRCLRGATCEQEDSFSEDLWREKLQQTADSMPTLASLQKTGEVKVQKLRNPYRAEKSLTDAGTDEDNADCLLRLNSFGVLGRSPLLDLELKPGQLVALVGPNGSGKSSLLAAIAGLLPKRLLSGSAHVGNTKVKPGRYLCGYVYQNPENQFVTSTVRKELAYRGVSSSVAHLADKFQLSNQLDQHPLTLSGGQSRRLSVATMINHPSPVILLDEPTYGQDWHNTEQLLNFIKLLCERGKVVVFATHDLEIAQTHATDIVILPTKPIPDERLANKTEQKQIQNPTVSTSSPECHNKHKTQTSSFRFSLSKLHPFVLFSCVMPLIIAAFAVGGLELNFTFILLSLLLILASGKPAMQLFKTLGTLIVICGFFFILAGNLKSGDGGYLLGNNHSKVEITAALLALISLLIASGINTDPNAVIRELVRLFKVPYRVGIAAQVSLLLAKRFRSEFRTMRQSRALRGVGKSLGFFGAIFRWFICFVPLIITSVRHGERVSISMDSRAFGAYPQRTELITERWRWFDTLTLAIWWTFAALVFLAWPI